MKISLVYPVCGDLQRLASFLPHIPQDIDVVIYEKSDSVADDAVQLMAQKNNITLYSIPKRGEQHFAFILHILRNYSTLEGMIHLSKAHWIPVFSKPALFLQELRAECLYAQHRTFRKTVCLFPDAGIVSYKQGIVDLFRMKGNDIDINNVTYNIRECIECKNNLRCERCTHFNVKGYDLLFSRSYLLEHSYCIQLLKEIFPDIKFVTEFNIENIECSYMIDARVLLFHNISVYQKLLTILQDDKMSHDECSIFFHLFFRETAKRFALSKITVIE